MANEKEYEWVSPSTLARRLSVSVQTIYNKIKSGNFEVQTFQRGKMRGMLIKVVKDNDTETD